MALDIKHCQTHRQTDRQTDRHKKESTTSIITTNKLTSYFKNNAKIMISIILRACLLVGGDNHFDHPHNPIEIGYQATPFQKVFSSQRPILFSSVESRMFSAASSQSETTVLDFSNCYVSELSSILVWCLQGDSRLPLGNQADHDPWCSLT